ncbi:unnamed protein product [Cylindrotheca closterium]|uniref:Uncharacterized protein n=1 Tax=Cylindrotheca closterium TaxID=2856 RepID=A0AAD2JH31_9STRA|nr:unnamed protein product [Cylindrotheca closterium]
MDVNELSYRYQGNEGETVPKTVQKLTFSSGIQVLPDELCYECRDLQEVTLPERLVKISDGVFYRCTSLWEIKIQCTVESIGDVSFMFCKALKKVEFEESSSSTSPHRLEIIGNAAFASCSLQRIKIPSSVNTLGKSAFDACNVLIEADLSTTSITEIPRKIFSRCRSLQTVRLPNSLERLCDYSFFSCIGLVTVIVPIDSKPIKIGEKVFGSCRALANIVLPKGSTADEDVFVGCTLLHGRFGGESDGIVDGLVHRFDTFPVHRICYDNSSVTTQELGECIQRTKDNNKAPFVDEFGMTPFHVLFSTISPREDLLEGLLEKYVDHDTGILDSKDANGKQPLDYLVTNWTETSAPLLETTLQRWAIDPLVHWGTTTWMEDIQRKVQAILLAEDDNELREALYDGACSDFAHYRFMEITSIFEMALWKGRLKGICSNDGAKRQALEREECRCVCGSHIVIPNVVQFLEIPRATSQAD